MWLDYLNSISTPHELARESSVGPQNLENLQVLCAQVKSLLTELEKNSSLHSQIPGKSNQPTPVAYLERLSVPNFSGKELDYPDFKHKFNRLTKPSGLSSAVLVEHLFKALPFNMQYLIKSTKTLEEAWTRLDAKYGKTTNSIVTIRNKLYSMDFSRAKPHERVKRQVRKVYHAENLLEDLEVTGLSKKDGLTG